MAILFNKDDHYLNYTNDILNHRMLWWRIMLKKDHDFDNIIELINKIKENRQFGNYCDDERNFNAVNVLFFNEFILKNKEKTFNILNNLVDIGYDINHSSKNNSNILGIIFMQYLSEEKNENILELLPHILDNYNIEKSIYLTDFKHLFFKSHLNFEEKETKMNNFFDILCNYYIINFSKFNNTDENLIINNDKDKYNEMLNEFAKKQLNKNINFDETKLKEVKKRKI